MIIHVSVFTNIRCLKPLLYFEKNVQMDVHPTSYKHSLLEL